VLGHGYRPASTRVCPSCSGCPGSFMFDR
jgi:hypothetical protein